MFDRYESLDDLVKVFGTCRVCGSACHGQTWGSIQYRSFTYQCEGNHYIFHGNSYKHKGKRYFRVRREASRIDDILIVREFKYRFRKPPVNEVTIQLLPEGSQPESSRSSFIYHNKDKRPTKILPWGKFKKAFAFTQPEVFKEKIKKMSKVFFLM